MNIESFRDFCLIKNGVTEELPFGPDTLVYKVMGKMFALTGLNSEQFKISLKNTPEKNEELRAEYSCVTGAYHMNKRHWSTILIDGSVKDHLIKEWINESYDIVVNNLPKKIQGELNK
ncbi:MmcQ/YjbR family DNA-binding protein [Emticicia sp. BO119]|uniref:MmcQ/YjbR family DNA-binding protein n=1 Tax=Emticicia sp. BO119 TaxID=2757768 RepID=UPI0015F072FE|nr:MmcQ/YjbR family DNA-binding protein [Emticicia sp. BO119]MBA4853611.1 MmcQ/YjbR family DNA-binding protein [Emticicia sp. BO119]